MNFLLIQCSSKNRATNNIKEKNYSFLQTKIGPASRSRFFRTSSYIIKAKENYSKNVASPASPASPASAKIGSRNLKNRGVSHSHSQPGETNKNNSSNMFNIVPSISGSEARKIFNYYSGDVKISGAAQKNRKNYQFSNSTLRHDANRELYQQRHCFTSRGQLLSRRALRNIPHDNNAMLLLNSFFFGAGNATFNKKNQNSDSPLNSQNLNSVLHRRSEKRNVSDKKFLIRKPSFINTNHKVTIQLFYYVGGYPEAGISNQLSFNSNSTRSNARVLRRIGAKDSISLIRNRRSMLTSLSAYLAQLYKKEVSLVIIRLHYPYLDSYILAQYLTHNAPNNTFIQFQERIFTNAAKAFHSSDLPSYITGIKVQIAGRLVTESVIPRITVKSSLIGSFSASNKGESIRQTRDQILTRNRPSTPKARRVIDYSRFTHKNNLGSFTIKVWIALR